LIHALLVTGHGISTEKTRRFCDNLLHLEPALWAFVRVPGVEPTNNSAEVRPVSPKTDYGRVGAVRQYAA
jgi:hypothetical protein